MRLIRVLALFLVLPTMQATAQQQQQTPLEQALGAKLLGEINAGLACSAESISLKAQLAAAQARIKEIEAKLPPEPTEK